MSSPHNNFYLLDAPAVPTLDVRYRSLEHQESQADSNGFHLDHMLQQTGFGLELFESSKLLPSSSAPLSLGIYSGKTFNGSEATPVGYLNTVSPAAGEVLVADPDFSLPGPFTSTHPPVFITPPTFQVDLPRGDTVCENFGFMSERDSSFQSPPLSSPCSSESEWSHSSNPGSEVTFNDLGSVTSPNECHPTSTHGVPIPFPEASHHLGPSPSPSHRTPVRLGYPGPDIDTGELDAVVKPPPPLTQTSPSSSSLIDSTKEDDPTFICRWISQDGHCGTVVTSLGLPAHMKEFHLPSIFAEVGGTLDELDVSCLWEGCRRKGRKQLLWGQIYRHIRCTHLDLLSQRCALCNRKLSRADSHERHLETCKSKKVEALKVKETVRRRTKGY